MMGDYEDQCNESAEELEAAHDHIEGAARAPGRAEALG